MNTLKATLSGITVSSHISFIDVSVGEDVLHLLLAEPIQAVLHKEVTLVFKETEIILSRDFVRTTANVLTGLIRHIRWGEILSSVELAYHDTTIRALVPTRTLQEQGFMEDEKVYWMIQPSEISLRRDNHGF
ncbi:MAG: hypothetical protein AB7S65_00625 [Sulfuricurvum sp.]